MSQVRCWRLGGGSLILQAWSLQRVPCSSTNSYSVAFTKYTRAQATANATLANTKTSRSDNILCEDEWARNVHNHCICYSQSIVQLTHERFWEEDKFSFLHQQNIKVAVTSRQEGKKKFVFSTWWYYKSVLNGADLNIFEIKPLLISNFCVTGLTYSVFCCYAVTSAAL